MKNIKWRTVITAVSFAILALVFSAVSVKYVLLSREYERYKKGIFSRSYETLVEALCDYRETKDPSLAERISFSASALPLGREYQGYMTEFCCDVSLSKSDEGAATRAAKYCDTLLSFLSEKRESLYKSAAIAIPKYPSDGEAALPVVVMPTEGNEETIKSLRKQAEKLLNRSYGISKYLRSDEKKEILGFRTANSYAEYDLSTKMLVKAVIYSPFPEGEALPKSELISLVEDFLTENGYSNHILSSASYGYGALTAVFECAEGRVTVSASDTSGRIRSLIAE